jgi:hypothetical protein
MLFVPAILKAEAPREGMKILASNDIRGRDRDLRCGPNLVAQHADLTHLGVGAISGHE